MNWVVFSLLVAGCGAMPYGAYGGYRDSSTGYTNDAFQGRNTPYVRSPFNDGYYQAAPQTPTYNNNDYGNGGYQQPQYGQGAYGGQGVPPQSPPFVPQPPVAIVPIPAQTQPLLINQPSMPAPQPVISQSSPQTNDQWNMPQPIQPTFPQAPPQTNDQWNVPQPVQPIQPAIPQAPTQTTDQWNVPQPIQPLPQAPAGNDQWNIPQPVGQAPTQPMSTVQQQSGPWNIPTSVGQAQPLPAPMPVPIPAPLPPVASTFPAQDASVLPTGMNTDVWSG